ncbi:hypothetical protein PG989_012240 [Apiospora arundinis]
MWCGNLGWSTARLGGLAYPFSRVPYRERHASRTLGASPPAPRHTHQQATEGYATDHEAHYIGSFAMCI